MKVIQLLPELQYGDAVSNDAIALKKIIADAGYTTHIYAEKIGARIDPDLCGELRAMPSLHKQDVLIYHKAIGTDLSFQLEHYPCKRMMLYHNITPPAFFKEYDKNSYCATRYGLEGAKYLADKVHYCLADSPFNKLDLEDMGYRCKIDVLPILIPFADYEQKPNREVIKKYNDGWVNIVFVGRVVPNKKQEDLIKAFYYYKRHFNHRSRLIIVGAHKGMDKYFNQLKRYVQELQVEDVVFTDHIKFDEILGFYKVADVFLCMSEHEGFCVPLVEAMYFNIPILAYGSTAIPYTLQDAGVCLQEKDPIITAGWINKIISDQALRDRILEGQRVRLKDFSYDKIKADFEQYLKDFVARSTD